MQHVILALVICMSGGDWIPDNFSGFLNSFTSNPGTSDLAPNYQDMLNEWWKNYPPKYDEQLNALQKQKNDADPDAERQQSIQKRIDDLQKKKEVTRKYIRNFDSTMKEILNTIQNPFSEKPTQTSLDDTQTSLDDLFVADLHAHGHEYVPWMNLSPEAQGVLKYQIPQNSSEMYFQNVKEKKTELLKGCKLEGLKTDLNYRSSLEPLKKKRKTAFRAWFTQQKTPDESNPEDSGFVRTSAFSESCTVSSFQKQILEYFVDPEGITKGDKECAQVLNDWMKKRGVKAFNEEDCTQRPWYVVGCFFELVSVDRFHEPEMRTFLPLRDDFRFSLAELRENGFDTKVIQAVQRWLDLKFALEPEQLDGKSLKELLDLLDQQLSAVRPYHRYLKKQYEQSRPNKEADFLDRFLH